LQEKRAKLATERKEVQAQGGDTSEIDSRDKALVEEERSLVEQERQLNRETQEIFSRQREILAALSGGGAGNVAGREAGIASREKDVARREKDLAAREAALSKREQTMADRWKESCAAAPSVQTIVKTVDAKGSTYTKKDVEPLLKKARKEMSKKGLLPSDLPDQAQGLEKEATSAMKEGDFGRAHFAASQLVGTVKAIKIDKAFIAAKIQRLNQRMKAKKPGASTQKKIEQLFREATSLYGDAKFSQANKKLNAIFVAL